MKNTSIPFIDIIELEQELLKEDIEDSSSLLIQVFCASAEYNEVKSIQSYFKNRYPNAVLLGTTTDGVINGTTVYTNTKSIVTFTLFTKTTLHQKMIEHPQSYNGSFETGVEIAKSLHGEDVQLLITFTDGIFTNGEEYLKGISSVDKTLNVAGGMAADNGKLVQTYIFNQEKVISSGAIAVALKSKELHSVKSYIFDWMPIGKKLKISKSIKNRVYEIDNIPVVDIYAKYMGREIANLLPQVGIEFPLMFHKGDVMVGRAPILKHDDGSLTFTGNIEEGEEVQFGVGNIDTILRSGHYQIDKLFSEIQHETQAVFIYSCMARRRFLGSYIENELQKLQSLGGVSGFFTYGEFFHSAESNQLLNETMTIVTLSESATYSCPWKNKVEESEFRTDSEHVVAHLANIVSKELAELNEDLEKKIQKSSEYIYKQAYFDKLTSLPNRLSLIKKLDESIGEVLFLINIDDFTIINDFYGHTIGDQVLVKLAAILKKCAKEKNATVYKLPSDEYAIIMDIEHNRSVIELEIKHILETVEKENFLFSGHFAHVSVTISAAFINKDKTGLINADMTLKLAKKARKDFMIFEKDLMLAQQYEKNIRTANMIRDAISNDKIIPYFQPIFDTTTLKVEKYEALVRLVKDDTVLTPYHFLDISQKIKLYPQITEIMVEKTFSMFELNGENFSINLAFSDITNHKTQDMIFKKIVEHNIARQLTIEILENQVIEDDLIMFEFIDKVYSLGAKIAIDDFGSGFANFEYMTKIRSDYMKIDGSLIKNIATDNNARLVVETIVVFAEKLGKKTVAEFVHSKEVYNVVKEIGIDYVQGFYLAEPSPMLIV